MRVLFSCRPGLGHFHPVAPLASALMAAGHTVQFVCSPDTHGAIQRAGFAATAVGLTDAESRERRARAIPELREVPRHRMRSLTVPKGFADIELEARLPGMLGAAREYRPHLMIHESAEFAGPLVAAKLGVPSVNHSFGLLITPEIVAESGRQAAPHWQKLGLPVPQNGGMYGGLYLDLCPPGLQEPEISGIPRVHPIRPTPTPDPTSAPWLEALGGRPVVSVTLGTVFNNRLDLFAAFIGGLEGLEVEGVVALGPGVDRAALGALPANVRVFDWVPWSRLLEKTSVVVGHGGANSVLGPLSRGIPLVVVPLGADHFVNAAGIARAGAGVVLEEEGISPAQVRAAVQQTMSSPLQDAAMRIAAEIAAMPSPSEVVPVLEKYVRL